MPRNPVHLAAVALLAAVACGAPPADDAVDTDVAPDCARPALDLAWAERTAGYELRTIEEPVPWTGEPRRVDLNLWYPTDATTGDEAAYLGIFGDPHALEGAPFADPAPGCRLPLVVYAHGSQSWGGSASTLARHLVAQGWVAAAPDHTGNVFVADDAPHPLSFSLQRVLDVRHAIDAVAALPDGHPLAGRVDTDHVLVVGHSYGAQTAWLTAGPAYDMDALAAACDADALGCTEAELDAFASAEGDPRVAAVMPLDGSAAPAFAGPDGWADVRPPILAQSRVQQEHADMFERASTGGADVGWVSIEGSCHESFTGNQLACDTLPKAEGLAIVGTYLSAFAAVEILGEDDPSLAAILDGTTVVSERVTLRR